MNTKYNRNRKEKPYKIFNDTEGITKNAYSGSPLRDGKIWVEAFANQEEKGKERLPTSKKIQDYLYNMYLIKISLHEIEQDNKEL